jgi:hypothetical protein
VDKVTVPDEEGAILPPTRHTPLRPRCKKTVLDGHETR